MKISKRQLRRIIKEEKAKLQEIDPNGAGMQGVDLSAGVFSTDYIYNMFYDDLADLQSISPEAFGLFRRAVDNALASLEKDLVR